jgi:hypothetical protein
MELKDFIAQTISQVMEGIKEAQDLTEKVGGSVNPKGQIYSNAESAPFQDKETTRIGDFIYFDVAVEVTEGKAESGGAKISIPTLGGLGGKLSGKMENRLINRVKFRLPVIYPKGDYSENERIAYTIGGSANHAGIVGIDSSASILSTQVADDTRKPPFSTGEEAF